MAAAKTVSATEFKAKCLDILDRISRRELERVTVTKRGTVVAIVLPPEVDAARVERLHGFLRGSVIMPKDIDLTAPISGEAFVAERGRTHG